MTEYSEWLVQDSTSGSKADDVLKEAKRFFITRRSVEFTAQALATFKSFPCAIESMRLLSHFLPNKFTPKHGLLKLYQQQTDTANMKKAALEVLNMPVKIHSAEVNQIKNEARLSIDNYGR